MLGVWGILYAGAAYMPLSIDYPEERLRYMIQQSQTKLIICSEALREKLAGLSPEGTRIVTPRQALDAANKSKAAAGRQATDGPLPGNLAYVIYTSGSTGKPKGVMIEHRSIANQMRWLHKAYQIGPRTVILQKTPVSFDAAQWEILAVACGSKVVMGAPGIHRDARKVIETIVRHEVTALQCVPTVLQRLVDTGDFNRCFSLTQLFSGGEALTRRLAREILGVLPNLQLVNLYGPTECTINSSAFTIDSTKLASGEPTISIGTPVLNTDYFLLNHLGHPVSLGHTGELYIGGDQLARGYPHHHAMH